MELDRQRLDRVERELRSLQDLLRGTRKTFVRMPSGLSGINHTYDVIGRQLGSEPTDEAAASTHPWKVTANGDNTVSVAAGFINWWDLSGGEQYISNYTKFEANSSIAVESGGGFIVACYTYNDDSRFDDVNLDEGILELRGIGKYSADALVKFAGTLGAESENLILIIAEVSLDGDGNAQVDNQIITHNPIVEIGRLRLS